MIHTLPLNIDFTNVNGCYITPGQRMHLNTLLCVHDIPMFGEFKASLSYSDEPFERATQSCVRFNDYTSVISPMGGVPVYDRRIMRWCRDGLEHVDGNGALYAFLLSHDEVWWRLDFVPDSPAPAGNLDDMVAPDDLPS